MRKQFGEQLADLMHQDPRIWLLSGDLGFGVLDPVKQQHPNRFVNTGAAEQLALGVAVGLAQNGLCPVVYSITPFLLYRPFEWIRNYLDHERIPVKLVGAGRDRDYGDLGFSHWAEDDQQVLQCFPNIKTHWPETPQQLHDLLPEFLSSPEPAYLNLRRN